MIGDEYRETTERMIDIISKENPRDKKGILKILSYRINSWSEIEKTSEKKDPMAPHVVRLLREFYKRIETASLIEPLPVNWVYNFRFNTTEISLRLCHIKRIKEFDIEDIPGDSIVSDDSKLTDGITLNIYFDAIYKVLSQVIDTIDIEDFARMYNTTPPNVRQWIRRGRIREAYKINGEWKLPILTCPPRKHYTAANFEWCEKLNGLPKEYMFLNDYYYAIFYQSRENKSEFKVLLLQRPLGETVDKDKRCEITLNTSAREKLEMFMIAHPQIHFVGGEI